MLRTVHLHGRLGKELGRSHRFDVATAGEALRALKRAFPGRFADSIETAFGDAG
ncbi:putative phage tail protein [Bradyrhizobium sp. USDA 326]